MVSLGWSGSCRGVEGGKGESGSARGGPSVRPSADAARRPQVVAARRPHAVDPSGGRPDGDGTGVARSIALRRARGPPRTTPPMTKLGGGGRRQDTRAARPWLLRGRTLQLRALGLHVKGGGENPSSNQWPRRWLMAASRKKRKRAKVVAAAATTRQRPIMQIPASGSKIHACHAPTARRPRGLSHLGRALESYPRKARLRAAVKKGRGRARGTHDVNRSGGTRPAAQPPEPALESPPLRHDSSPSKANSGDIPPRDSRNGKGPNERSRPQDDARSSRRRSRRGLNYGRCGWLTEKLSPIDRTSCPNTPSIPRCVQARALRAFGACPIPVADEEGGGGGGRTTRKGASIPPAARMQQHGYSLAAGTLGALASVLGKVRRGVGG